MSPREVSELSQAHEIDPRPVDTWCRKLSSTKTLIFTRTVSDVAVVANDELTSASDLSEVIGHDVSMATRLIRIASSALFNRYGRTVDSINTAIVRIGFDAIRELAVSLALIEQVLDGRPHQRVTQTMSRAFHAAAQAQSLAKVDQERRSEEVFAATLLLELGSMLFWSQCGSDGDAVEALMAAGVPEAEAQSKALGFSSEELTAALAKEWHLGKLLQESLQPDKQDKNQVRLVRLGHEIALTVERWGWESQQVQRLVKRIAETFELKPAAAEALIENNYLEAQEIAKRYGVTMLQKTAAFQGAAIDEQPSSESQLEILQEIGQALNEGQNLNQLVALILKGIRSGLGFDRAYFALLSPDKNALECRYGVGSNPEGFIHSSRPLLAPDDLFNQLLVNDEPRKFAPRHLATQAEYAPWLSFSTCVMMPIVVLGKPVGVLYADKAASSADIKDDDFRGFQLFGQQLVSVLRLIRDGLRRAQEQG